MSWYVNANNETRGPTGEETVIRWIREGNLTSGKVCRVGSDQWIELTGHLPFAAALRDVAPPPPIGSNAAVPQVYATNSNSDSAGLAILLTPVVATVLMFLAGQYVSIWSRGLVVGAIGLLTVVVTAIMVGNEAARLKMGNEPVEGGEVGNGAGAWFLATLAFWIFAYPWFLHKRHWYGPPSRGAWAILVTLVFLGSWWAIAFVTEIQVQVLTGRQ